MLTGLAGTVVGANEAYRWSVYLLVCCWPLAIYSSARLFGFQRSAAAAAAILSPFVVSFTGVGFEHGSYLWIGGAELWTQLLGSWVLPFAWAATWRAMKEARFIWVAAALIGLTVGLHFMCGYLAFLGVFVLGLSAEGRLVARLARSGVLFAASLAAAAWVIVPLVLMSKWSAINQPLAGTQYMKGYGVRQELIWLFTGQVFDAKRALPIITDHSDNRWRSGRGVLAQKRSDTRAPGVVRNQPAAQFRVDHLGHSGLPGAGPRRSVFPALRDGQPTGRVVPGRYRCSPGLAGPAARGRLARRLEAHAVAGDRVYGCRRHRLGVTRRLANSQLRRSRCGRHPAYRGLATNRRARKSLRWSRTSSSTEAGGLMPGSPTTGARASPSASSRCTNTWRARTSTRSTYLVPTLSLMLDPETNFDEDNPADYALFGIRYILLPTGTGSPVPAQRVMVHGPYSLWQIKANGYVDPVEVTGALSANRADVGSSSLDLLYELGPNEDWSVRWPGLPRPPAPSLPGANLELGVPPPGNVDSTDADLASGSLSTNVTMHKAGTLLLSVSYDPGWHAWVDGRPVATEMLAPALIGIPLGPGQQHVIFRYIGFRWYPELWALGLFGLAGAFWAGRRWRSSGI